MDEFRRPDAAPPAGDHPDSGAASEADDDQVEPDVVTHELAVRRVLDNLLGLALARRVALAEISLRSVAPLAPVLQLRRFEDAPDELGPVERGGMVDDDGVDGTAGGHHDGSVEAGSPVTPDVPGAAPDPPGAAPDVPGAAPYDPEAETVDASRPRGGVVVDLARYRAGRRGFGRRGRVIDLH